MLALKECACACSCKSYRPVSPFSIQFAPVCVCVCCPQQLRVVLSEVRRTDGCVMFNPHLLSSWTVYTLSLSSPSSIQYIIPHWNHPAPSSSSRSEYRGVMTYSALFHLLSSISTELVCVCVCVCVCGGGGLPTQGRV